MKVTSLTFYLLLTLTRGSEGQNFNETENEIKVNLENYVMDKVYKNTKRLKITTNDRCLIKLIRQTVYHQSNTYVIIKDGKKHETLIDNLLSNFVHSYFTEPKLLNANESYFISFNHLLIFGNKFKLGNIIKQMQPIHGSKFFVLTKSYEDATSKFEELWKYRIIDVVATFVTHESQYYYTYFPYCLVHCGRVGKPYLLAKCNILSGEFSLKKEIFPQKIKNLHKCQLSITFTENVPASYYGNLRKFTGWEIELMNEIVKHLNGVPNYNILPYKKTAYRSIDGYGRLVKQSEVGGGLVISLRGLSKTDFCLYGQTVCAVWIVPRKTNFSHSAAFILNVFHVDVWLLIVLTFLIMTAACKIFCKASWTNVVFKLLPYLFGTTTRTKKPSRIFGTLWLWFAVLITSIFQSGYQSTILVPESVPQLTTTTDILKSDLKVLGVSDIITDAFPYFKEKYNISYRRIRLINRKLNYNTWVYRVAIKKDSAYLGFRETVKYHIDRTELTKKLNIPETCVLRYMLAFVMKRNSHLTESFVKFANRLSENGISLYLMRKHLSKESRWNVPKNLAYFKPFECDKEEFPPSINMNKMFVVFMCHFLGNCIAFVVFLIELMLKKDWRKIKMKIWKEINMSWSYNIT